MADLNDWTKEYASVAVLNPIGRRLFLHRRTSAYHPLRSLLEAAADYSNSRATRSANTTDAPSSARSANTTHAARASGAGSADAPHYPERRPADGFVTLRMVEGGG